MNLQDRGLTTESSSNCSGPYPKGPSTYMVRQYFSFARFAAISFILYADEYCKYMLATVDTKNFA